jgi:hypothetical protein
MFKRRRTYDKARPDQFQATSVVENACWVSSRRVQVTRAETQDTAAPSHAFKPTVHRILHRLPASGAYWWLLAGTAAKIQLVEIKEEAICFLRIPGI